MTRSPYEVKENLTGTERRCTSQTMADATTGPDRIGGGVDIGVALLGRKS